MREHELRVGLSRGSIREVVWESEGLDHWQKARNEDRVQSFFLFFLDDFAAMGLQNLVSLSDDSEIALHLATIHWLENPWRRLEEGCSEGLLCASDGLAEHERSIVAHWSEGRLVVHLKQVFKRQLANPH